MLGARDCVADAMQMESWNGMDPKVASLTTLEESCIGGLVSEKPEELCSTAVPSPALTASAGSCGGTWGPQDFEAFALIEESFATLTLEDPLTDAACQVPMADLDLDFADQSLLPPAMGFLPEEGALWDGFVGGFGLGDVTQEECQAISLPGHAETGEWAWRIAPRPCLELDDLVPLVVRLGGAPDGSASLEVASGLEGFCKFDEEGSKMLDDVWKCEPQERPTMTIAELHSLFHSW